MKNIRSIEPHRSRPPGARLSPELLASVSGGEGISTWGDLITLATTGELTKTNDDGMRHWRWDKTSQELQYSEQLYGKNEGAAPVGPTHNIETTLP
jgi:hypothetical protein